MKQAFSAAANVISVLFLTNVKNHIEAKHLQAECHRYKCTSCGKFFKTKIPSKHTSPDLKDVVPLSTRLTFEFEDFEAQVDSRVLKDDSDGSWRCSDCSYSTQYLTNLRGHIETHHVTSAGFLCPTCSKFCLTKNALRIHKRRYKHNE